MLRSSQASCAFRLLTLAVMLGALWFVVSTENVRAATDSCDTQFGYCIYQNCQNLSGQDYINCRDSCDRMFEECLANPSYDPIPAPYPVITHNLQWCLQGCQSGCASIPDPDHIDCIGACYDWCFENNPKP